MISHSEYQTSSVDLWGHRQQGALKWEVFRKSSIDSGGYTLFQRISRPRCYHERELQQMESWGRTYHNHLQSSRVQGSYCSIVEPWDPRQILWRKEVRSAWMREKFLWQLYCIVAWFHQHSNSERLFIPSLQLEVRAAHYYLNDRDDRRDRSDRLGQIENMPFTFNYILCSIDHRSPFW